jgi:hypothetical protein
MAFNIRTNKPSQKNVRVFKKIVNLYHQTHKIMKTIALVILMVFFLGNAESQNCLQALKKGTKLTYEIATYPLTIEILGPKQAKMKQKEKDEIIDKYKSDILSGTIKPTVSSFSTEISNVTESNGATEYEASYTVAGVVYKSYMACKKDSVYIYRIKGIQYSVWNNDTLGFALLGTQILPVSLKVNDATPGYSDIGESFPKTETRKVQHKFNVGEDYNPYASYHTTYYGTVSANETWTSTSKYYKIFQGGNVIGEENFSINGKDYKSYIIGNETWTKFGTNFDIKVEEENYFDDLSYRMNHKINKQIVKAYSKGGKKTAATINEVSGANEQGYVVSYKEDWFVPEVGIVKTITYDNYGNITSISKITSLE